MPPKSHLNNPLPNHFLHRLGLKQLMNHVLCHIEQTVHRLQAVPTLLAASDGTITRAIDDVGFVVLGVLDPAGDDGEAVAAVERVDVGLEEGEGEGDVCWGTVSRCSIKLSEKENADQRFARAWRRCRGSLT